MLAARVEPKNGPKENKEIGNFKPLVLSQFQAAVDNVSAGQSQRTLSEVTYTDEMSPPRKPCRNQ